MSRDILISLIDADPDQPRCNFDAVKLQELAASMVGTGLIVPIMVRPNGDRFIIVHGERRYRAAKALGWEFIPADVRELDTDAARWFALVENVQRADLSPIEEAKAFRTLLEGSITQGALGERIGKTQSYIAQKLRLLKLPDTVQAAIEQGSITEGHARQLLKIDDYAIAERYCEMAIAQGLSVAALRNLIDSRLQLDSLEMTIEYRLSEWEKTIAEIPVSSMPIPTDFRQMLKDELLDSEIVELLSQLYTNRYYKPRLDELRTRLGEAQNLHELMEIAHQAGEAQNVLTEQQLRLLREAGKHSFV